MTRNVVRGVLSFFTILLLSVFSSPSDNTSALGATIGNRPGSPGRIASGAKWVHGFEVQDRALGASYRWQVVFTGLPPWGVFDIDSTGYFSFSPAPDDSGRSYDFRAILADRRGVIDQCDFAVAVLRDKPLTIRVYPPGGWLPGTIGHVSINKEFGSERIGGFDFTISWDTRMLGFINAEAGKAIDSSGGKWEVFSFRQEPDDTSWIDGFPRGVLRITAAARQNRNLNPHTSKVISNGEELVRLTMRLQPRTTKDCGFQPIRFVWSSDRENLLTSISDDSTLCAARVFDWEWDGNLSKPYWELTGKDMDSGRVWHQGGPSDAHNTPAINGLPRVIFWNGGIDMACDGGFELRGDMNLNGIADEIADLREYCRLLLHSPCVSEPYPAGASGLFMQSDINADGVPFTVADLTYLERIIVGDAKPYARLNQQPRYISVTVDSGIVAVESAASLGALQFTYAVNSPSTVENLSGFGLESADSSGVLSILLHSFEWPNPNFTKRISPGFHQLFHISGDVHLINVQASDYDGNLLRVFFP
jgi:hypothetical protein